jgi:type I restriction enzyme, S subunit
MSTTARRPPPPSEGASAITPAGVNTLAALKVPSEWSLVPLGSLCSFANGANADKSAYGAGVPFINVLEVITHTHIHERDIPGRVRLRKSGLESFAVHRGDVLFNRTSETQEEVGLSAVYDDDATVVFGGFVIRGRFADDSLDSTYVGYGFRASVVRSQIVAQGQGAIRANIGQANLKRVLIPVPPKREQRAIAEALSDVDALLGELETLSAKKRAIKQATTQELLTGKLRLPQFERTARIDLAGLGTLPVDWAIVPLKDACLKIQDGTHFSPVLGGSDYLYVTSRNIGFGTLNVSDADTISEEEHRKIYTRCDTRSGDLLLTKDGASTGNAALNTLRDECSLLSSVAFLRFDHRRDDARFFLQYILSNPAQRRLKEMMSGNAITRLTLEKINSFRVPRPSLEEQQAIATVLSDMDAEIAALERRRDKTQTIKQGMMQ